MQINRCFEMVYLLLERGKMTAGELAEHFEVSVRTIYRDIDTLSLAGIPVYCTKGKGGGVQLMEDFILNKSILSGKEKNEILFGLQSLQAARYPEIEELQHKLSGLFGQSGNNWIEMDMGGWNHNHQKTFSAIREAMTSSHKIEFDYYGADGELTHRKVEPIRLSFKEKMWYLYAYCGLRADFRMFKVTRIRNLKQTGETFNMREWPESEEILEEVQWQEIVLELDGKLAYRVYDEFDETQITKTRDGNYLVSMRFPEDGWVYSYIMSFGLLAKVISPDSVRSRLQRYCEKLLEHYKI